ncbi:hemerythrin domain-containing protein [Nocardia crassostreae]|uniref:hemerythrin domain-containing protein n=1 Tax=Nocardia crassostreae TaxID=53428 RepID=UPI00082DF031|nr:hemerythrin domain-containing protein [Nocardia crassostreae]
MSTEQDQDVVELLMAQHNRIRALIEQVNIAPGQAKRPPFEELVRLLAVHETAEEEVVHPAARQLYVADQVIDDARLQEEEEAKAALAELHDLGVEHIDFDRKFRLFAEKVIEHSDMEEKEEFGMLLQHTSQAERTSLGTVVRIAESVAPTRPHPGTGESALGNVAAGPPLALFDRVRDALRDWRRQGASG